MKLPVCLQYLGVEDEYGLYGWSRSNVQFGESAGSSSFSSKEVFGCL